MVISWACMVLTAACQEDRAVAEHPFILWDRRDLESLRLKVETEPWAKEEYRRLLESREPLGDEMRRLFRYAVMGDREAGEAEKKALLALLKAPEPLGGAQEFNVLRYDLLYDRLDPAERAALEKLFRRYIDISIFTNAVFDPAIFNDERRYSRYDARRYTRTNWLPNIIWPRKVSAMLMAVALRDQKLIRDVWEAYGSWKWYFDEYLCDTGFYSEEFSKMGSTPGAMLLVCRGLERLDLDALGYGYRGRGGATMRGHLESIIHLGYPKIDLGSSRPQYPMVTIGDLRMSGSSQSRQFPGLVFQHSIVTGYLPDGRGGNERWIAHGAWGGTTRGRSPQWDNDKTEKMQIPFWFEIGHAKWPDAGFDFFLAQMRAPDEERYVPSLHFGLDPIDPRAVRPPPAPSAVWPQRGIVMLRAEEGPEYWESPAPALSMRLATAYAHSVNDSFCLPGFYAFNRPIYIGRHVTRGYAEGWSRSIRSHNGVMVDSAEPRFTNRTVTRPLFRPPVKAVMAASPEIYEGVVATRALFLTRDYLADIYRLASGSPHTYRWFIHAPGTAEPPAEGNPSRALEAVAPELREPRSAAMDGDWSMTIRQTCALKDHETSQLGKSWYAREIGVRVVMAGEPGTTLYWARTPTADDPAREVLNETGGVTVVVERSAEATTFEALHVPFQKSPPGIALRRIARSKDAAALAVWGQGVSDRILVSWAGDDQHRELAGAGEEFSFGGLAFVRIAGGIVDVHGEVSRLRLKVEGAPTLRVNGQPAAAAVAGGLMTYPAR